MKYSPVIILLLLFLFAWSSVGSAVSVTGSGWRVHYNLPDQDTTYGSASPDEYAVREALLARIRELDAGDQATLTTYSFSGDTAALGAAGPIINTMNTALDRGASIRMVVDSYVDTGTVYGGTNSLDSLAGRSTNPLILEEDDSPWWGLMHNKLGLFDYAPTNQWVFITSWNFTGGASSYQWNIALEAESSNLYAAYSNEMAELLAGRFHDDPTKSHAHDKAQFTLPGGWGTSYVRFVPSPDATNGGDNAVTDITNLVANAESEIVFALNKLTLGRIATQLVSAADRGVMIHGVMPESDTNPGEASAEIYSFLTNTASYAGSNVIHFHTAYAQADHSAVDTGHYELVHTKYMVIDPLSAKATVIHGSANWTFSGLQDDDNNDENVVFVRHRAIAGMFYAQFKRMTGAFENRDDAWCEMARSEDGAAVMLWTTDTNTYVLESASSVGTQDWTAVQAVATGYVGRITYTTNLKARAFYRGRRKNPAP